MNILLKKRVVIANSKAENLCLNGIYASADNLFVEQRDNKEKYDCNK